MWFADAANPIPLTPANMAFATMLLSCVTMAWAVDAVGRNDRRNAYFALGLTILFGGAVINATSFLYTQMGLPIVERDQPRRPALLRRHRCPPGHHRRRPGVRRLMTFRTLGGEYPGRDREGIVAASLIWYLTTAIYGVIWYAIYMTK